MTPNPIHSITLTNSSCSTYSRTALNLDNRQPCERSQNESATGSCHRGLPLAYRHRTGGSTVHVLSARYASACVCPVSVTTHSGTSSSRDIRDYSSDSDDRTCFALCSALASTECSKRLSIITHLFLSARQLSVLSRH